MKFEWGEMNEIDEAYFESIEEGNSLFGVEL